MKDLKPTSSSQSPKKMIRENNTKMNSSAFVEGRIREHDTRKYGWIFDAGHERQNFSPFRKEAKGHSQDQNSLCGGLVVVIINGGVEVAFVGQEVDCSSHILLCDALRTKVTNNEFECQPGPFVVVAIVLVEKGEHLNTKKHLNGVETDEWSI